MHCSPSSISLVMFTIAMFVIESGDRQTDMQVGFELSECNFDGTESLDGQTCFVAAPSFSFSS
jgi:hypothetical protein